MKIYVHTAATEVVENVFRDWDDTTPWSVPMVRLAVACAEYSERMVRIAHLALKSLPQPLYEAFLETHDFSRAILRENLEPIAKVEGEPLPVASIEERRAKAVLDKSDLLIALALIGLLTPQEAEDAAAGIIPASLEATINGLPPEQQMAARIKWRTDTVISRTNPVIEAVAVAMSLTVEQLDAIFGIEPFELEPEEE